MNSNPGPTATGQLAWHGATPAATPIDIHNHTHFGFTIKVNTVIAVAAVFNIKYHDGTPADPCVPDAAQAVPEVAICSDSAAGGPQATMTIPVGTPAGTLALGTIACRPGRFISLEAVSGDTGNVDAVMVLIGPKY